MAAATLPTLDELAALADLEAPALASAVERLARDPDAGRSSFNSSI